MSDAVRIEGLDHTYQNARGKSRDVLSDLRITVHPGEVFGLLGPNGGGKTTLFRILSTSLIPTRGRVHIFDTDVVEDPAAARRKIGVVFQSPSLDKNLTLLENVETQGNLYGLRGSELRERTMDIFKKLSLQERAHDRVDQLSGGLQRRGEIAKGLLHKPQLLLMDEPSTGLDPGARRELWELINELKRDGVTILVTTHLMEEGEKCDRLGILHHGRCMALGTPAELKKKIGGDMVIVQTQEPLRLAEDIKKKFGGTPVVVENTVRIERQEGHKFIPELVEAFPGMVDAVSVGKPTLEDVFIGETGQKFGHE